MNLSLYITIILLVIMQLCSPCCWRINSKYSGTTYRQLQLRFVQLPLQSQLRLLRISQSKLLLAHCDQVTPYGGRSTLLQVMACCLTTPSYYPNQCWLIISKVLWHSTEGTLTLTECTLQLGVYTPKPLCYHSHWSVHSNHTPNIIGVH